MGGPTCEIMVEEILSETDSAILIQYEGQEVWIPKSQLIDYCGNVRDQDIEIEVTQWILEEKGLV